jgi:hypothetical protein
VPRFEQTVKLRIFGHQFQLLMGCVLDAASMSVIVRVPRRSQPRDNVGVSRPRQPPVLLERRKSAKFRAGFGVHMANPAPSRAVLG